MPSLSAFTEHFISGKNILQRLPFLYMNAHLYQKEIHLRKRCFQSLPDEVWMHHCLLFLVMQSFCLLLPSTESLLSPYNSSQLHNNSSSGQYSVSGASVHQKGLQLPLTNPVFANRSAMIATWKHVNLLLELICKVNVIVTAATQNDHRSSCDISLCIALAV